MTHFAKDKRAVYFTATRQDSEDRQLRRFAERLREQLGDEVRDLAPETFPSWEAALRFVVRLAEAAPLLLVIDEAPRLAGGMPTSPTPYPRSGKTASAASASWWCCPARRWP